MVTKVLIISLLALLSGWNSPLEDKPVRFAPVLWACDGEVRIEKQSGEIQQLNDTDCAGSMVRPLEAGDRVVVVRGTAMLTDTSGAFVTLEAETKKFFHEIQELPVALSWLDMGVDAIPFAKRLTTLTVLKGDEFFAGRRPYVTFSGDGPALTAWQGILQWHRLPSGLPLVVRVFADDRLVYGPRPFIEPIFDLARLSGLESRRAEIEVLIVDSPVMPNESVLRMPLESLRAFPGQPVTVVLRTEVFLEGPEERKRIEKLLARARSESQLLDLASDALDHGRLNLARKAVASLVADETKPPLWDYLLAGVEVFGDLEPYLSEEEPDGDCDQEGGDGETLWHCFWRHLGPAVAPEVPPPNRGAAKALAERLRRTDPDGWRPRIAAAQLALLSARHAEAREELEAAKARCRADPSCSAAVAGLGYLVDVDAHSSFDRVVLNDALVSRDPGLLVDMKERLAGARRAIEVVEQPLREAASIWYAAARVRYYRIAVESLKYIAPLELRRQMVASLVTDLPPVVAASPGVTFLVWSTMPRDPPPALPEPMRTAAMLLHAEAMIAPNGGLGSGDISAVVRPADAAAFLREGVEPPQLVPLLEGNLDRASALLASRSCWADSPLAAKRLLLSALGSIRLGRWDEARHLLAEAEVLIASYPDLENRTTHLVLQAELALGLRQTPAIDTYLGEAEDLHRSSGAAGRMLSLISVRTALARRAFYLEGDHSTGVRLMQQAATAAVDQKFLGLAPLRIAETAEMLQSVSRFQEVHTFYQENLATLEDINQKRLQVQDSLRASFAAEDAASLAGPNNYAIARGTLDRVDLFSLANLAAGWTKIRMRLDDIRRRCTPLQVNEVEANLDPQTLLKNLTSSDSPMVDFGNCQALLLVPNLQLLWLSATTQATETEKLLEAQGDREASLLVRASARGDHAALTEMEQDLAKTSRALEGPMTVFDRMEEEIDKAQGGLGLRAGGVEALTRVAALQRRERYFGLCARLRAGSRCREELRVWDRDDLSAGIVHSQPWRRRLHEAQVLEREGNLAEAGAAYDEVVALLRDRRLDRGRLYYPAKEVDLQIQALNGSARIALEADGSEGRLKALNRIDEILWFGARSQLTATAVEALPGLPELPKLAAKLGQGGTLAVLNDIGRPGEVVVWLFSQKRGLRIRQFFFGKDEPLFPEALRQSASLKDRPTPIFVELALWLANEIPPGAPVALILTAKQRGLGAYRLPVDGEPLLIRNPVVIAPSLRDLGQFQTNLSRLQGSLPGAAVGVPLNEGLIGDNDFATLLTVEDDFLASLVESDGEHLLWGDDATHEKTVQVFRNASWIHISTHGVFNTLNPQETGLNLANDILSVPEIEALELPGPLVVLSSCQSGEWNSTVSAENVGGLDLAFLRSGASSVVSTTISVEEEAARAWMEAFHSALREGQAPIHAAYHAYRETRRLVTQPEQWAAFTLVGAGMGSFK